MVFKNLWRYLLILLFGLANILPPKLGAGQMTPKERKALNIAQEFITKRYPDFDKRNTKLVINDRGDSWEITYELPENMAGGAPVVIIDKRTMKVVRSFHTQ